MSMDAASSGEIRNVALPVLSVDPTSIV